MAEEEKGAKWWFRYVFVPVIGGGGLIALITTQNGQKSPPAQVPAAQLNPQPNKPTFTFNISYDPKTDSPPQLREGTTVIIAIKVYIDDVAGDMFATEGRTRVDGDFKVSTLGRHRYNITGLVGKTMPDGQEAKIAIGGEGTIYVQDGSEFRIVLDRAAPHHPNQAIMKLERAY